MAKPHILMFGWEYAPYLSGGLGVVTRSIVENLIKQGVKLTFVLPKVPNELRGDFTKLINASKVEMDSIDEEKFTKIMINSPLTSYTNQQYYEEIIQTVLKNYKYSEDQSDSIYGNNLIQEVERYSNKAVKIAEQNYHNIIHTHDWMTAKAGVVAKEVSGNPLIMHVHATEFDRSGGNPNQEVYDIEREGMEKSDCVIAVSELTKQKIVQNYGISPDKIKVIHNAIDKYKDIKRIATRINQTDKIVLFLGRLTMQKGADYLLEAAEKVLRHRKRVKFVFIGYGDMIETLIKRSIDLGIEQKVMFTGFMEHNDVDKAYQMADVFVMPSVSEPFGITTLEAIKNGTPVIISKQSGVSEVIKNALKVDFWDVDELANQILAIIRYAPLSHLMTKNAEQELYKIDWETQSKKIVNIYNEVISK